MRAWASMSMTRSARAGSRSTSACATTTARATSTRSRSSTGTRTQSAVAGGRQAVRLERDLAASRRDVQAERGRHDPAEGQLGAATIAASSPASSTTRRRRSRRRYVFSGLYDAQGNPLEHLEVVTDNSNLRIDPGFENPYTDQVHRHVRASVDRAAGAQRQRRLQEERQPVGLARHRRHVRQVQLDGRGQEFNLLQLTSGAESRLFQLTNPATSRTTTRGSICRSDKRHVEPLAGHVGPDPVEERGHPGDQQRAQLGHAPRARIASRLPGLFGQNPNDTSTPTAG